MELVQIHEEALVVVLRGTLQEAVFTDLVSVVHLVEASHLCSDHAADLCDRRLSELGLSHECLPHPYQSLKVRLRLFHNQLLHRGLALL